jgi:hypothetical protein
VLLCLCLLAVALHVYVGLFEWTLSAFSLAVVAWSLVPYVVCVVIAYATGRQVFGAVPAFLALALDAYTFIAVHFLSHSSTATLAYLWVPFWNLVLVVPLGAAAALLWVKLRDASQRAP